MRETDLEYLLSIASTLDVHEYPEPVLANIYDSWIHAAEHHHESSIVTRNSKGYPRIALLREGGSEIGTILPTRLPSCPRATSAICHDKQLCNELLKRVGVRIAESVMYESAELALANHPALDDGRLVAVKAPALSLGRGVFLNVSRPEFAEVFDACLESQGSRDDSKVLVQEMVEGFEIRAVVIEGAFHHAIARIPAYVTGTGRDSISKLIEDKNARRQKDYAFRNKPIRRGKNLTAQLELSGLSLDYVPGDGENVLLSSVSNTGHGGGDGECN